MKRFFVIAVLAAVAAPAAFGFPIRLYSTTMDIKSDGSILVSETITADFTADPHHGIYRDITLGIRDSWGNESTVRISDITVTDPTGRPEQTLIGYQNGNLHIRIGDPNVLLEDSRTYVIRYRLERAIGYFEDHDELYWNVVGDKWEVPIERAYAEVKLPAAMSAGQLRAVAYTGAYGSTASDVTVNIRMPDTVEFTMNRTLNPGEGMTIAVAWPKGIVAQPSAWQRAKWFFSDRGYFFLPVVFLIGLVGLWFRVGKDPDTRTSEVVLYDPPDGMNPSEIGTLIDEKVDMRDIAASVIDLAVRGYITIEPIKGTILLWQTEDHWLKLTKPYEEVKQDPKLSEFEKSLVTAIFGGSQDKLMSSLKNNFYTHIPTLQNKLYDAMVKRHCFAVRPDSTRIGYVGVGVVLIAAGVAAAFFFGIFAVGMGVSAGWGIAGAVCGVMLAASAKTMPRKTMKGKNALIGVKGFEEYLSRAEGVEVRYQEEQNLFEKFLPYAIALGIADRWAHAFEKLDVKPPEWYSGGDAPFSVSSFVSDMNHAANSWAGTMSSQPRSSGGYGGGGGFSGGGSCGGGGGGGGGGGW